MPAPSCARSFGSSRAMPRPGVIASESATRSESDSITALSRSMAAPALGQQNLEDAVAIGRGGAFLRDRRRHAQPVDAAAVAAPRLDRDLVPVHVKLDVAVDDARDFDDGTHVLA